MAQTVAMEAHLDADAETISPSSPTRMVDAATEGVQRQTKRLAHNFPLLLPTTQVQGDSPTSSSPKYSSPLESARSSPRLAPQPASLSDPNSFLTTLAAQERRVLELREELHIAESDLAGLKKQWATFEANRKKSGIRQVEQLQPLPASHLSKTDAGGGIPTPLNTYSFEKLAAKPTRRPQQRVFSGSRHTRTLSLLTTTSGDGSKAYPEPFHHDVSVAAPILENENSNPTLSRSSTMPGSEANAGFGKTYKNLANRRSMPQPSADVLVKTGRQMASDLRDGLWTFFEDIRQATVGDEGINGADNRSPAAVSRQKLTPRSTFANGAPQKKRSNTSLERSARRPLHHDSAALRDYGLVDSIADQSFWKEFGVDTPGKESRPPQKPLAAQQEPGQQPEPGGLLVDVDDDWEAWESPVSHQKTSPKRNVANGLFERHTTNDGTVALPWPELTKLTPSKLTRTVSDMMRDWDKPSPRQSTSQSDAEEEVLASPHV